MTVRHIIPDHALGGGSIVAARLMRALIEREGGRAHAALIPQDADADVRALFADLPHEVGAYPGRGSPLSMARAIRRAASQGDVIHAHGTRAALAAMLAAPGARLRTVYTVHGFHGLAQPGPLGVRARLEHLLARRMNATAFVSAADASLARRHGLRHRGPAEVIENGMSAPDAGLHAARDIDLLFVGRMVYQKNPQAFLETAARLPGAPNVVMIGAGELAAEVDALATSLRLPRFRRLDGLPPEETLAHMRRARILAMTSRWEGLPTVAVEAAQSGALVSGFEIPPLAEVLGPLAPETLTEAQPEALAARLAALLGDEPRRAALATRLHDDARTRYSLSRMAERYAALYDSAGR